MPFEFGDVLLLPFPFTDQSASKKRPAAVVSSDAYNSARPDVVVVAITSQIGRRDTDLVSDWQSAGLLKPSALKPVFFTFEQRLILKRLGRLTEHDRRLLSMLIAKALG